MFNAELYLVAELGINHNGDFETAKTLISKAANSGVNAIKFQYRNLSRTYESTSNEIGDESLKLEIAKNSLSVNQIISLYEHAKIFDIDVGISFFDKFDVTDFKTFISKFDFFKIPSVELTNLDLIETFYQYHKPILISTGAHSEKEIECIFKQIDYDKWVPMHCVSNYPVIDINSKLGYLKYMQDKWERRVGYSSHDDNWENCILAYTLGARIIERHITLDKKQLGLDHSTSSTPEEFKKLSGIIRNFDQIISGNNERKINQGELINLQNLSKSFFAKRSINIGEPFELKDFNYRHPRVGLSMSSAQSYIGKPLVQPCKRGAVLTEAHFRDSLVIPSKVFELCNKLKISLPIRLHDYEEIQDKFKINNFELHLSYKEVDKLGLFNKIADNHVFTIHLPDYQDSNKLLNPFTDEYLNKNESKQTISVVKNFAIKLSKSQYEKVIVVASFSPNQEDLSKFYTDCYNLQSEFEDAGLTLAYQWLPPYAWYFGGSVKVNSFNKLSDLDYIKLHNLNICLDTSHLLMSSNYYRYDPSSVLQILEKQIVHFHLADAIGADGEGIQLGMGEQANNDFLLQVINRPQRKVIEVWQGHLNLYQGFTDAMLSIKDFTDNE